MGRGKALRQKLADYRAMGIEGMLALARHRLLGQHSPFFHAHQELFAGEGLEIGGPSAFFGEGGCTPVYLHARRMDNVNFATHTRWEGHIRDGQVFQFRPGAEPGRQLVHDAGALTSVPDARYDFVASCHMLEHSANPLKALKEWRRVMKPGATLLLVLPHRSGTFDRHRPVTPLQHMIDDEQRGVGEDDSTHFAEVLALHDLSRDPYQPSREAFRHWVEGNAVNRGVHHHVFDSLAAAQLVDHAGFAILCVEPQPRESIFIFARKPMAGERPDNGAFTTPHASYLRKSRFREDRKRAA